MSRVSTYGLADGVPPRMNFVVPGTEADVYRFAADLVDKAFKQGVHERYVIEIAGIPIVRTGGEISVRRGPHGNRPDAGVRRGAELERVLKEVDDRFR